MKNKIIVDDLSNYEKEIIGHGFHGICYLTEDNKVFKKFHDDGSREQIKKDQKLSKYQNDSFVLPEKLIFLADRYVGYVRRYINGDLLTNLNSKENINDIILALEDFEKDLIHLSKAGIVLFDLNSRNLLYQKDHKLVAIDSDGYSFSDGILFFNRDGIIKENLRGLSEAIVPEFVGFTMYLNSDISKLRDECVFYGRERPSELLNMILDEISENSIDKLETIEDYKEGLNSIRKR